MSDSKEQLHSAITAKAELDRTVSRLIIEDVTAIMAKNLSTLLDVMERQHGEAMALLEVGAASIKKLEARMNASEQDRAHLHQRLTNIEQLLEARPAQREQEHKALMDAILERRADGD